MKVLKESMKEQKVLLMPRRPMRNPVASGVTVSQSDVVNDATKSKSPTEEQGLEEKVCPSRHQSMRKSRTSGELERDVALPAVQPSTKLPTAAPLNPVTPLRWKSSRRIEAEKKKLQEEIKTKEVVKEEKKYLKPAKDERKDESKTTTASELEINGIETSHKADTPIPSHAISREEDPRFKSSASTSESSGLTSVNEKARDLRNSHPVTNGGNNQLAKHCEEVSTINAKHGTDGDAPGTDRKPYIGDESSVITIDFLRARLLAERASSKAAKERIQQLTRKVQELEGRLDEEIQSKSKAEEAAREALLKFESLGQSNVSLSGENEAQSLHGKTRIHQQDQELSDQAEEKCQVPADEDDTRPNATEPGHTQSTSLEINDDNVQVSSKVEVIPTSEQETGDHHGVQSLKNIGLQDGKHDGIPTVPTSVSTNCDPISTSNSELKRQERRSSVEERVYHTWNQMAEEMAALAEDKTQEGRVSEELLNWMRQVPSVIQNVLTKPSEEKKLVTESRTQNMQLKDGDVPSADSDLDQALNLKEETVEERSLDGASSGNKSGTHDNGLKKVASLIERFEAQESTQREWKQSIVKQNSMGRRRSNEGSLSRMNSNPGTPESQQGRRHEELADVPLQVEDPRDNSHATDSSVSPCKGISAESLLIREKNGENGGYIRSSPVDRSQVLKSNQYHDPRALERNCKTPGGHSERSSGEIGESARSQALIDWVNLEEAHTSTMITNKGDSSLQWDAASRGRHLQHERLGPYSQTANSSTYIRQEVPGNYPLRNDEREIYRGRMESVSRSMEGLGSSWRSLVDPEGEETQLYADIPDSIDSATTRRSGLQMPFQVNASSGWSNHYQAENMEGSSHSFAYPGRRLSRENSQSRSSSTKIEITTSKVNEVLKALQLAKLSIQNTGGRRTSISNPSYPTSEHSYPGGEKHNLTTDYGFYDGWMTSGPPSASRVRSQQEISRRYSTGNFRDAGSPPPLQPTNSAPLGMLIEARRKYPEDQYLAGRSSPVSDAHRKLGDKISSGGGMQHFRPN